MLSEDFAGSESEDLKDPLDEAESADVYGYLSDSDLEDGRELPEVRSPSLESAEPTGVNLPPPACRHLSINHENNEDIPCEFHQERVEKYKVVKISDIAFVT